MGLQYQDGLLDLRFGDGPKTMYRKRPGFSGFFGIEGQISLVYCIQSTIEQFLCPSHLSKSFSKKKLKLEGVLLKSVPYGIMDYGSTIPSQILCEMSKKDLSVEAYRIHRLSLPETLAESLRERILNGELKEGDSLVQEAIAAEYGVSRMPVREAFRQLEAAGLIATRIHKGAVVTGVPVGQIDELFELRALLECQLLEAAIRNMTEAHLSESAEILPQLEEAYLSQDVTRWGGLNWEFHRSLYLPANLVQTLAVVQGINMQTDRYIRLQLVLSEAISVAVQEHRELLRLCAVGDVSGAVTHLRKHILDAGESLKFSLACKKPSRAV